MPHSLFINNLKKHCTNHELSIAFPESLDERIIRTIRYLLAERIVKYNYLFTTKEKFLKTAKNYSLDLDNYEESCVFLYDSDKDLTNKTFEKLKIGVRGDDCSAPQNISNQLTTRDSEILYFLFRDSEIFDLILQDSKTLLCHISLVTE